MEFKFEQNWLINVSVIAVTYVVELYSPPTYDLTTLYLGVYS